MSKALGRRTFLYCDNFAATGKLINWPFAWGIAGASERDRTSDLLMTNQLAQHIN
jgi:hypothetical protein